MTRKASAADAATREALAGLLRPGQSLALLQALHILTREGAINQDSRRKLKQVAHLVQFIEPLLQRLRADGHPATVVDHGAGKSYLGFILYDALLRDWPDAQVWGIESRPDLVVGGQALADQLGFDRLHMLGMQTADAVRSAALPDSVGLVTALHACDTATDDAIAFGLARRARAMALVPCCQAEVCRLLNADKARALAAAPLAELWRHPLHTRAFGSHVTNVLRVLYLQACGYQVTVTELVGWEHSLKNELILATRTGRPSRSAAQRLLALLEQLGLTQMLPARFAALADRSDAAVASADQTGAAAELPIDRTV